MTPVALEADRWCLPDRCPAHGVDVGPHVHALDPRGSLADCPRELSEAFGAGRDAVADHVKDRRESGTSATAINRRRRVAWLLMLIADAGLLGWGAMAALVPERLPGPGSGPILAAGYEGFTKALVVRTH